MKLEVGKTYLTREGEKAVVLCVDAPNKQPVIVMHADGEASNHHADGCFFTDDFGGSSGFDLISEYVEPPKPREVWIYPYSDNSGYGQAFTDAERAEGLRNNPNYAANLVKFREVIE